MGANPGGAGSVLQAGPLLHALDVGGALRQAQQARRAGEAQRRISSSHRNAALGPAPPKPGRWQVCATPACARCFVRRHFYFSATLPLRAVPTGKVQKTSSAPPWRASPRGSASRGRPGGRQSWRQRSCWPCWGQRGRGPGPEGPECGWAGGEKEGGSGVNVHGL